MILYLQNATVTFRAHRALFAISSLVSVRVFREHTDVSVVAVYRATGASLRVVPALAMGTQKTATLTRDGVSTAGTSAQATTVTGKLEFILNITHHAQQSQRFI